MDPARWESLYERIVADFGFDRKADEAGRDELVALLRGHPDPRPALRSVLAGRPAVVIGAGRPVDPAALPAGSRVVADKALPAYAAAGGRCDLIVTDLDGDPALTARLSARGVPVAVHAHGDNRALLAEWVPRLTGPVLGTTQVAAVPPLLNAGGFTDGDRACFLAEAFGATEIHLAGFDFERAASDRKLRKLAWARRLLAEIRIPVHDGTKGRGG